MSKRLNKAFSLFLSFAMLTQLSSGNIFAGTTATTANEAKSGSIPYNQVDLNHFLSDEILYGDLNGDGLINSLDLALMKRYVNGSISSFPNNVTWKAADLNFDGKVNSLDAAIFKRILLNNSGISITQPRISLETPANGATLSENINVKGWALDVYGVKQVEILVNGNAVGTAVYGDARADIQNAYPVYKNANAGYHFDLDTTKFANGSYTLAVKETNNLGIATTTDAITVKVYNPFDISLNCQVTDTVMDTAKDVMYITDKTAKKLYSVNCKTKEVSSVSFDLPPESVYFKNGKVYVALLKKEHDAYIDEKDEQGAIAVVDAASMKIESQIDVNIDPFDIEVLDDNYIIISSGSSQFTNIKCYSLASKQEVSSSSIRQQSYIEYNSFLNRLYTIDTDATPRAYTAYNISSGKFTDPSYPGGYGSPYHGEYNLGKLFRISPDGKYLFNSSGIVFACDSSKTNDMKYVSALNKSFSDIAFNGTQKFYTAVENGLIYEYNYSDFKGTNSYTAKSNPVKLYYVDNKLIVLGTVTQNGTQKLGIEIVNLQ
jgi:hypothetical protein